MQNSAGIGKSALNAWSFSNEVELCQYLCFQHSKVNFALCWLFFGYEALSYGVNIIEHVVYVLLKQRSMSLMFSCRILRCLLLYPWYISIRKSWLMKYYPTDNCRKEIFDIQNWTHLAIICRQVTLSLFLFAFVLNTDSCENSWVNEQMQVKTLPEFTRILMNLFGSPFLFQLTLRVHTFDYLLVAWLIGGVVVIMLSYISTISVATVIIPTAFLLMMYQVALLHRDAFKSLSTNLSEYLPIPDIDVEIDGGGQLSAMSAPPHPKASVSTAPNNRLCEPKGESKTPLSDEVAQDASIDLVDKITEIKNKYYKGPPPAYLTRASQKQEPSQSVLSKVTFPSSESYYGELFVLSPDEDGVEYYTTTGRK